MNLAQAETVAAEIVAALAPACERIEVAGSIRRRKAGEIKDVEVLAISHPCRPVFGQVPRTPLVARVGDLRAEGRLTYRLDKNGRKAAGEKYQRLCWNGYGLDLFIVTPVTWGMAMVIRTGDADFSHLLVTPQSFGGAMPPGLRCEALRLRRDDGSLLDTPEERDVFAALGLAWIEPPARTARALR